MGEALEWLVAFGGPAAALPVFLDARFGPDNRLREYEYADLGDRMLSDSDIDAQLLRLSLHSEHAINFIFDDADIRREQVYIANLREQINATENQIDSLQRLIDTVSVLDPKFTKDLEFYKNQDAQRSRELCAVTEECENLISVFTKQKTDLYNSVTEETVCFLDKGKEFMSIENFNFKQYFTLSEQLNSYLKGCIKQLLNEDCNTKKHTSTDTSLSQVNAVLCANTKIEDAILNYIKVKAGLDESKQLLKFNLKCRDYFFVSNHRQNMYTNKFNINESQEVLYSIREFVRQQITFVLYGELETSTMKFECIKKKLNYIFKFVSYLFTCSEILLSSLNKEDEFKQGVLLAFYSAAKLLISQLEYNTQNRRIKPNIPNEPQSILQKDYKSFKRDICELFQYKDDTALEDMLRNICSQFCEVSEMKNKLYNNFSANILASIDKNEEQIINVKKFVWDGPAYQPNMCNKKLEYNIYELEEQNSCNNEKVKNASRKFVQLKEALNYDITLQ